MSAASPIRIVLVDDHGVVRAGLRALLDAEDDLRVVGEEGDGLEAIELIDRLRPDVAVVDLAMPGLNGLEVIREVTARTPATRLVVLSMHASDAHVRQALRSGAAAYVVKDVGVAELVTAVREAVAGRRYLSAPFAERAIEAYVSREGPEGLDRYGTLTAQERKVFHLAAQGLSHAEVAARLGIRQRTAETHRANLMRKLDLHSQAELAVDARRRGLLADS